LGHGIPLGPATAAPVRRTFPDVARLADAPAHAGEDRRLGAHVLVRLRDRLPDLEVAGSARLDSGSGRAPLVGNSRQRRVKCLPASESWLAGDWRSGSAL